MKIIITRNIKEIAVDFNEILELKLITSEKEKVLYG
jgi:hypothetical protein